MIGLPRSTFYYRPVLASKAIDDERMAKMISAIQDELPGYGYRCATEELARRGQVIKYKRVARVMRAHGPCITPRWRFVCTTDSAQDHPVFLNLYRNVIPSQPIQVWVGDITTIRLSVGFCYLAVLLDATSRRVVGYALSRRMNTQLTLAELKAAVLPATSGRLYPLH